MNKLLIALLSALLFAGCQGSGQAANATSQSAKRYPLHGKVVAVDRTAKKATIEHDAVEGFMDAMTMDFPIHADWIWDDLKPGSEIRAELVVDKSAKEPYWLENVGIVAASIPGQGPAVDERFAQIGKPVPDLSLTNQDGKHITLNDFRGKVLAITFIYSKCPLPDYCIKMSKNFSDLANQIMADEDEKEKFRLLSISFDPAHDTPAKLKSYGLGYLGKDAKPDFSVWQLAVGTDAEVKKAADFFGVRYEVDANDKTQFNHSLRTAVIAPDGTVTKIFPGNEWSSGDLLREMNEALSK